MVTSYEDRQIGVYFIGLAIPGNLVVQTRRRKKGRGSSGLYYKNISIITDA
jgi:hypothetical protein